MLPRSIAALLLFSTILLSAGGRPAGAQPSSGGHFADADNLMLVTEGARIYGESCASCHGRRLQGQALWQLKDQFAGRRAPAHDATGHTWQHSDEDLFQMTKFGRFPTAPPSAPSHMPAFGHGLSDHEILAVIAFIKSRWPLGLRASQAMLNPGFAGMPPHTEKLHWTLPPNCFESIQAWSGTSR